MKSFRRFFSLALVAVLLLSLIACGVGADKTGKPDQTTVPTPGTTAPDNDVDEGGGAIPGEGDIDVPLN